MLPIGQSPASILIGIVMLDLEMLDLEMLDLVMLDLVMLSSKANNTHQADLISMTVVAKAIIR